MADLLATYHTGWRFSAIGRMEYELYTDTVRVKGLRHGIISDVGVALADLRVEPLSRYYFRGRGFKVSGFLATVGMSFPLITWPIFNNYGGHFTIWYLGCAVMAALGILGMLCLGSRFEQVIFSNHSGIPALGVFGARRQHAAMADFVAAIQTQIACVINNSESSEPQSQSETSA